MASSSSGSSRGKWQPNAKASSTAVPAFASPVLQKKLMEEREAKPAAEMMGPLMFRTIYGEIAWDTHPVSQMRIYQMSRKNVPQAVSILGEVDAMTDDVKVTGIAPVVTEDMTVIHATYQFKSITEWGEQVDKIGMSEENFEES